MAVLCGFSWYKPYIRIVTVSARLSATRIVFVMKYLIVGLGNIGQEYADTRHNIGFMIADELAREQQTSFFAERYAYYTEVSFKGRTLCLIKPTTYMNRSGSAVHYWLQKLGLPFERLLVIVDDLALPFGTIRLRPKGSDAGHNGLRDVQASLGTSVYPRLRFGIGGEYMKGQQVGYVLSAFDEDELTELPALIKQSTDMVKAFTTIGIQHTMTQYNK